nr:TPA_inf: conotoxin precursor Cerm08 [Conus judaeus]
MMLFMFAAIIFTMASTTVSLDTCANAKKVCRAVVDGRTDEICDCDGIPGGCIMDDRHKFFFSKSTLYTCPVSAFRICDGSETVFQAKFPQFNCRCASNVYRGVNNKAVCG